MTRNNASSRALAEGGAFHQNVAGFVPRQSQQEMADAVQQTLAHGGSLVAEAGTGTGKTFAYLVPALLSGKRVIVSTGTKTLQDQLFHRDLPRVRKVLGVALDARLLKGRANYLCRYRLQQTQESGERRPPDQARDLAAIVAWAAQTVRGDRMELAAVAENSPVWPDATSTVENCLGSACPLYDKCCVVRVRREAMEADLVVVNHHLLLADLALKQEGFGQILPGADAFLLDEAHQLPELAGQFFSQSFSARQMTELAKDALAECADVTGALAQLQEQLAEIRPSLARARDAMREMPPRGSQAQLEASRGVASGLQMVRDAMHAFTAALEPLVERSVGFESVHARASLLGSRLDSMLDGTEGEGEVRWYEITAQGFSLHATPLDLATPFQEMRQTSNASWVFTSATLSVANRFDHFCRQLGLDDPETLLLPSPFDYAHQTLCYLPPDLPEPNALDYTDCLIEASLPVLRASGGRAFLLFTSHRALRRAAALLDGKLPYPLLVQGDAPRSLLLDRFRDAGNAILLGAASFWAGVDVAGEALSCVIIDKLPFAAPNDPVLEARLDALRKSGENPFTAWQVPSAAIVLKQGAGRLIRHENDRGVLVLGDPRLLTKGYGRIFLDSLPPFPLSRDLAEVETFFAAPQAQVGATEQYAHDPAGN